MSGGASLLNLIQKCVKIFCFCEFWTDYFLHIFYYAQKKQRQETYDPLWLLS